MNTTKFVIINALMNRTPCYDLGLKIVNEIQAESGSGHHWNVKGLDFEGKAKTVFCRTLD